MAMISLSSSLSCQARSNRRLTPSGWRITSFVFASEVLPVAEQHEPESLEGLGRGSTAGTA